MVPIISINDSKRCYLWFSETRKSTNHHIANHRRVHRKLPSNILSREQLVSHLAIRLMLPTHKSSHLPNERPYDVSVGYVGRAITQRVVSDRWFIDVSNDWLLVSDCIRWCFSCVRFYPRTHTIYSDGQKCSHLFLWRFHHTWCDWHLS